jgi:hypothetical protein
LLTAAYVFYADFLLYYPAKTYKGRTWSVCGSGLGFRKGAVNVLPSWLTPETVLAFYPAWSSLMFGTVCNTEISTAEGERVLGMHVPVNAADPKTWSAKGGWTHPAAFGSRGSGTCPKAPATPAPAYCDGGKTGSPTTATPATATPTARLTTRNPSTATPTARKPSTASPTSKPTPKRKT